MRQRGDSIGSILLRIVKWQEEFRRGAIHTYPNHWIFSEGGCTNSSGYFLPAHENKVTGRLISLKNGKGASNCQTPPDGDFVPTKEGKFSVPWKVCLKCPHHINSVRPRGHFCAELKRIRSASPSGAEEAASTYGKAVQMASDMMGGKP